MKRRAASAPISRNPRLGTSGPGEQVHLVKPWVTSKAERTSQRDKRAAMPPKRQGSPAAISGRRGLVANWSEPFGHLKAGAESRSIIIMPGNLLDSVL